jgi:hypothetical protein
MPGGIHPPLEVIASWPTPNFDNPEMRGWGLVITTTIITTLSVAIVAARIIARSKSRNMGIDDWIIIASMARIPSSIHGSRIWKLTVVN